MDPAQTTTPTDAASTQQTITPAVTPPAVAVAGAVTPEQTTATPVADAVRNEINSFASSIGMDPAQFSGFSDVAQAREAARMQIEGIVRMGMGSQPATQPQAFQPYTPPVQPAAQPQYQPQYQSQQPATPAVPAIEPLDLGGLPEDDPAVKMSKHLYKQMTNLHGIAMQSQQELQQMRQAQQQEAGRQALAQANQIVDGWKSPLFGVGANRTQMQQEYLKQAYALTDALSRMGLPLAARLEQARLVLERQAGVQQLQPAPQGQQQYALNTSQPGLAPPAPGMKMTDKWSSDPQFMAALSGR